MVLHEHPQHLWCVRVSLDLFGRAAIYSHPQPQSQLPSVQGQSAPQLQPQPQPQPPGVRSLEVLIRISPLVVYAQVIGAFTLQTHPILKYYTPGGGPGIRVTQ